MLVVAGFNDLKSDVKDCMIATTTLCIHIVNEHVNC